MYHVRGLYQCSSLNKLNKLVLFNSVMICIVFNLFGILRVLGW
jgi:hypothetical protein